jgi:hypothetical protein
LAARAVAAGEAAAASASAATGGAGGHRDAAVDSAAAALAAAADSAASETARADEGSQEPCCRICHGGAAEAAELGPLLAPCRCRGSMRLVHLGCLNQWRRLAPTPASAVACDQCGYAYQFERTRLAALLLSPNGALLVGLLAALALLYGASGAVRACVPGAWQAAFWAQAWRPALPPVVRLGPRAVASRAQWPAAWAALQAHVDFLAGGAYVFGVGGFAGYLAVEVQYARGRRAVAVGRGNQGRAPWWRGWLNAHSCIFVVWLLQLATSRGYGPWKVVLVIGVGALGRDAAMAAHALAQRAARWLGERMLEVQ